MNLVRLASTLFLGAVVAAGCGGSDSSENGDTGGKGSGGKSGADGGGGTANGSGTGATGTGATGTGATGTGATGTGATGTGASGGVAGGTGTGAAGGAAGGTGTGATGTGATGTGATGTGATDGGAGSTGCAIATCQGHLYACGNCIDDDGDGFVDMADPDCLGPCHNAENTYYGSIPGQAGPACDVDCYFDQDSGNGNDDCFWNHKCDPLAIAPNYPPEGLDKTGKAQCPYDANTNISGTGQTCAQVYAQQSATCANVCGTLTPNGCDCFGCCELPSGGGKYVWLGSEDPNGTPTCSLKDVADPAKCQPCTPVQGCLNTCQHCELCLGKTTLPPDCLPPPTGGGGGGAGGTTSGGGGSPSGGGTTAGGGTSSGGSPSGGTTGGGGSPSGGGTTSGGGTGGVCGGQLCPAGHEACGLSCQPPCPAGKFCLTGCCTYIPT